MFVENRLIYNTFYKTVFFKKNPISKSEYDRMKINFPDIWIAISHTSPSKQTPSAISYRIFFVDQTDYKWLWHFLLTIWRIKNLKMNELIKCQMEEISIVQISCTLFKIITINIFQALKHFITRIPQCRKLKISIKMP